MIKYSLLAVTAVIFLAAGGGGVSLIQEADAADFAVSIIAVNVVTDGSSEYAKNTPVDIKFTFDRIVGDPQAHVQLANANFVSYYDRNLNTPSSGKSEIFKRIAPVSNGFVTVTLPAGTVTKDGDSNLAATYTFTYDNTDPYFVGYPNLDNTYNLANGADTPTLPSITRLCDDNTTIVKDAVRGTTTAIDTSTAGTYTNTYVCTDDAGNDATLSIAYVVAPAHRIDVVVSVSNHPAFTNASSASFELYTSIPVGSLSKTDITTDSGAAYIHSLNYGCSGTNSTSGFCHYFTIDVGHIVSDSITISIAESAAANLANTRSTKAFSFTYTFDNTPPEILKSSTLVKSDAVPLPDPINIIHKNQNPSLRVACFDNLDNPKWVDISPHFGFFSELGSYPTNVSCTDNAGNKATKTLNYKVIPATDTFSPDVTVHASLRDTDGDGDLESVTPYNSKDGVLVVGGSSVISGSPIKITVLTSGLSDNPIDVDSFVTTNIKSIADGGIAEVGNAGDLSRSFHFFPVDSGLVTISLPADIKVRDEKTNLAVSKSLFFDNTAPALSGNSKITLTLGGLIIPSLKCIDDADGEFAPLTILSNGTSVSPEDLYMHINTNTAGTTVIKYVCTDRMYNTVERDVSFVIDPLGTSIDDVVYTVTNPTLTNDDPVNVDITTSKNVRLFSSEDVSVTGGTGSLDHTCAKSSNPYNDYCSNFTLSVVPSHNGTISVSIPEGAGTAFDGGVMPALSFSFVFNGIAPEILNSRTLVKSDAVPFTNDVVPLLKDTPFRLLFGYHVDVACFDDIDDPKWVSRTTPLIVTSVVGPHASKFVCTDSAGNEDTLTLNYNVVEPVSVSLEYPEFMTEGDLAVYVTFGAAVSGFDKSNVSTLHSGDSVVSVRAISDTVFKVVITPDYTHQDGYTTFTIGSVLTSDGTSLTGIIENQRVTFSLPEINSDLGGISGRYVSMTSVYSADHDAFGVSVDVKRFARSTTFVQDSDHILFAIQDGTPIAVDKSPDKYSKRLVFTIPNNANFNFTEPVTFRAEFETQGRYSGTVFKTSSLNAEAMSIISDLKTESNVKEFTITNDNKPFYIVPSDLTDVSSPVITYSSNFSFEWVDRVRAIYPTCLDDDQVISVELNRRLSKTYQIDITDNSDEPVPDCDATPTTSALSYSHAIKTTIPLIPKTSETPGNTDDSQPKKKKSSSSNDWHKKPTFGQSHLTYKQIVDNGFSFNGHDLTITDNWHTDFLLTSSIIGESNTVTIKTYSADPLKWVDLHLGVPRQGGFSEAESHINLVVSRNYTNPVDYTIDEINHYQKENLIDESDTTASVNKVKCQSTDNDEKCYEFTILFAVNAPLMDNVVAISAMDEKRRQHVTYINEGVEFTGTSLLDPHTAQLMEKLGNQYDATIIELTQQDRRYNIWEDQHGYLWSQNEYGTWMQTTHPDFERFQDNISNVMTRQNSNFASLIEHERQKALLVFDSSDIASQVGDYFAYDYSDIDRDTSKLEKYYLELRMEEDKAMQYTSQK